MLNVNARDVEEVTEDQLVLVAFRNMIVTILDHEDDTVRFALLSSNEFQARLDSLDYSLPCAVTSLEDAKDQFVQALHIIAEFRHRYA